MISGFDDLTDPFATENEKTLADLSAYDHILHHVNLDHDEYDDPNIPEDQWDAALEARHKYIGLSGGANVFSSRLAVYEDDGHVVQTGQHTIALDLDFPCQVVEGGGKTIIGLDFLAHHGVLDWPGNGLDLGPLLGALANLGVGNHFQLTPRGVVFETTHRARWVESSTPGHGHLYIDAVLWWEEYEALLQAFAWAGLVEPGYVGASMRRQATHLRLPWVRKADPNEVLPF